MTQDASKVLMGSHGSSDFQASCEPSDPATFTAGLAVRRKSTGELSLSSSDGPCIGVSLGEDLSDSTKTSVCREGNRIPLQLPSFATLVKADLTFSKKVAADVSIEFLDTGTAGAEVVTVTGDADDGYLISVSMEDGVSTATQMKAAIDAEADALALIDTEISGTGSNAQSAFAEDAIDTALPVIGAAVRVSNTTGQAVASSGTLTGACYVSGVMEGVKQDGSFIPVALIDMAGGL